MHDLFTRPRAPTADTSSQEQVDFDAMAMVAEQVGIDFVSALLEKPPQKTECVRARVAFFTFMSFLHASSRAGVLLFRVQSIAQGMQGHGRKATHHRLGSNQSD